MVYCMMGLASLPADAADEGVATGALAGAFDAVQDGLDMLIPAGLKSRDFRVRLGAGIGMVPSYRGADDFRLRVVPLVDIRYKDRLRLTHNRLTYDAVKKGYWSLGPLLRYKTGRRERRSEILKGLGDIKPTAELGVFAKYRTDRMLFNMEYRHALGAQQGSTVRASFGHAIFKSGNLAMAAIIRGKWLSGQAMQTNFGITEAQAATSEAGLAVFEPRAGISEASVSLLARYQVAEKYRLLGLVGFGRMLGDAAKNPLVADGVGNRDQFMAGVGFTIDF